MKFCIALFSADYRVTCQVIDTKRSRPNARRVWKHCTKTFKESICIVALFIVLVYGMAALVAASSSLESLHRLILVIFLVTFPIIVLFVFYALVTKHVEKLYGPKDYQNDDRFLEALGRIQTEPQLKEKAEKSIKEANVVKITFADIIKPEATNSQLLAVQYGNRWNSGEMVQITGYL